MEHLFMQILNMSITSCYVIIFVMVARLLLKKCPKIFSYVLWSVVFFRLACPFALESTFSLLPSSPQAIKQDIIYSQNPNITTGINAVDNVVNQSLPAPIGLESVNPIQIWLAIGQFIWILGIVLLILYSIYSTVKLFKKLKFSQHISDNIYITKEFISPFVFGIIAPKIYLPLNISKKEQEYILLHEQRHIQRLDHIIKPIAFLVVCLHWFNPLVWIAFFLMGEDMELSCDESVIKQLGNNIKKEYSSSLLSLSTGKRIIGGSPIAFGENNIKSRIKNILYYKKPAFWVVIVIIILITVIGIGLVTNPKDKEPDLSFLNPNNLSNLLVQNKNEFIKIANYDHKGFTKLPAYKIADWINDTEWKEKKVLTPNKLQPTYAILNIHSNDVNSEIRLYESEPNLAMILYNDKWRYYTINDEAYNKFKLQFPLSSYYYYEPFEATDNISMTDNRNEIILPDFKYNGDDEIMKLVYKTEIENYGYRREGGFLIPAVHIHGSYEEENKLKVFVTIYDDIYKLYGNKVKSISGGVIPSAITFTINDDGSYIFDKSEQARDGSEFPISIKEFCTYPVSGKKISGLADKIMKHYGDYDDLIKLQRSNLIEHLNTHNQIGVSLITDYDDSETQLN